jgi:single-strand DNA-binding protein
MPRRPSTTSAPSSEAPASPAVGAGPVSSRNEVTIAGRLAAAPEPRELPSGDVVVIWRVVVERDGPPVTGRPHLDTLECAAWSARLRRTALSWQAGDIVEVHGALRRRFWRSPGAAVSSRYEIEAAGARRLARA